MTEQPYDDAKDVEPIAVIWLQPWCTGCAKYADGREWCETNAWGDCEECGRKAVKYELANDDPRLQADVGGPQ